MTEKMRLGLVVTTTIISVYPHLKIATLQNQWTNGTLPIETLSGVAAIERLRQCLMAERQ